MNYELKSIQPGTVFVNAIRIFLIVGFLVALLIFFILPNPVTGVLQKLLLTGLYTVVYGVMFSAVFALIAFLYNVWAQRFPGVKFHIEQSTEE